MASEGIANKKLIAGLMGIFFGGFGIHKFVLGYTTEGLIMLLVSVLTCFIAYFVMVVVGIIEGIIYLSKTDDEFEQTYVVNKKGWF